MRTDVHPFEAGLGFSLLTVAEHQKRQATLAKFVMRLPIIVSMRYLVSLEDWNPEDVTMEETTVVTIDARMTSDLSLE
jgi:hypothetical protein